MKLELTQEQFDMMIKSRQNPIYFLNNCLRILHPYKGMIPFKTYPFQNEMMEKFLKFHNLVVLKSRQVGASTIARGIILWCSIFFSNFRTVIISSTESNAIDFLRELKDMLNDTEDYIKENVLPSEGTYRNEFKGKLKNNEKELIFLNGSSIKALSATSGATRSKVVNLLVIDEGAHIANVDKVYEAIYPTISRSVTLDNKKPFGVLVISTPNGIGNWYAKTYQSALERKNNFHAVKVHWRSIPDLDENWYVEQCKALNWDYQKIAQELDLSFVASGKTYIPSRILNSIETINPVKTNLDETMWIWDEPREGIEYVMGVDIGYGNEGNDSSLHILNGITLEQVVEFTSNKISIDELADLIIKLGKKYNNAYINVERNDVGMILLQKLAKDSRTFGMRFLRDNAPKELETKREKLGNKRSKKERPPIGTLLTGQTRELLMANMYEIIVSNYASEKGQTMDESLVELMNVETNYSDRVEKKLGIIKSDRLLNQLLSFIVNKRGKPEGQNNKDDIVLSYAHALWCYSKIKHLLFTDTIGVINEVVGTNKNNQKTKYMLDLYRKMTNTNFSNEDLLEPIENEKMEIKDESKKPSWKNVWGL